MAEVNIPALFDRLGEQMLGLSQTIKSQGVTLDVTPFDGKAKDFKNWMKAVEKHARLNQLNEDQTKLVAYKTSRGAVSDYLDRVLNEHPGYEWERIKNELSSRFAEISDAQHAFTLPCGAGSTVPREGFDSSVIMPFSWCVVAVTLFI